ncbi:MAG TPA: BTAD domain-containing putative transcriptional regulator [Candidatus Polarisedimenticolia bacterium]|nr:BTAD domain-containing putative transcriptional regulator [Candidatus Polarisedimenticolia bacterium]
MTPVVSLIRAKLLPPAAGPRHLRRPRLEERLAAGLAGRATLVTAGPGYGKSSLAARVLKERGGDSVWYRLDPFDRDPWVLVRYLIEGIRQHVPDFGERSESVRDAIRASGGPVERLTDTLIRDAEESLEGGMVIVMDDVHHVTGGESEAALRRLLAYLPGTLHLILMGRSLPDLGAASLEAGASVQAMRGEDLLFTLEETRLLVRETFGLSAPEGTIRRIHERTRGWITALQLLCRTVPPGGDLDLPEAVFALTEPEIFAYFSEETLASEAEQTRHLLLAASLASAVDPDILSVVLQGTDARGVLSDLARRSLFLSPLESRGRLYALDPLFADFLRGKADERLGMAGVRELHRRYARAFAGRHEAAQSLRHWILAGEPRQAARLLALHGKAMVRAGMLGPVRDAAKFVSERGERTPALDDVLGEASRVCGDFAAAAGSFERALAPPSGAPLTGAARAAALQGLAYSLLKLGEVERARRAAEEALESAGGHDDALRARILNTLSLILYRGGSQADAVEGWQEALRAARKADDTHLARMIAHNLGLPHAVTGDFARAAECFHILIDPDSARLGPEEGAAYLNLARIETLLGRPESAAAPLGDAREIAWKWRLTGLKGDILEAEGNLLRETGDFEAARSKYAEARALFTELGRLDLLDGLAEEEALLASLRGSHDEAVRLADDCVERRRRAGDPAGIASSLLVCGRTRLNALDPARAEPALEEALRLFGRTGRAYESCLAGIWLSAAHGRLGRQDAAGRRLAEALALASRFRYEPAVLRVLAAQPDLARAAASLGAAPAWARAVPPEAERPARASLGAISPEGADLTARLLGPVEVFRDAGERIPPRVWKVRRALHMFCFLAASRDHRASKDRLADALWGEARLDTIEKNFHPTISMLRRALNHGRHVPRHFILYEGGAYLLNPAYRYDLDIETFDQALSKARKAAGEGRIEAAIEAYDAALELYRGPFMDEEYEPWAEAPRAHYEELLLGSLSEAAALHLKLGDATGAAGRLQRLVERDPFDEEASARLMRALGAAGDRAGVRREYRRLSEALREELSAEPLPATLEACEEALAAASVSLADRRRKR